MSINPEIASIADKLHLTTAEARVIHEKAVVQTFPKEAIILENGHHCDSLFFIIEGRVKVIILDSKGRESVLLQRGPGEYFGGPGFGAVPLSAMIMTVEPSRFLVLPKVELKAFLPNEHALLTQLFEFA